MSDIANAEEQAVQSELQQDREWLGRIDNDKNIGSLGAGAGTIGSNDVDSTSQSAKPSIDPNAQFVPRTNQPAASPNALQTI